MSDNVVQGPESWRQNIVASLAPDEPDGTGIGGSGGGPPSDLASEARVTVVEESARATAIVLQRIEALLVRIDDRLRKIETEALVKISLEAAELKGRVAGLPNTVQLVGLILSLFVMSGLLRIFGH